MKTIFKAVATVTIFSIITRLLGFFFRIFLSRKLSAEGLGLFQMSSSILTIFLTLISSGLPLTTAKMVSKYETQHELKKRNIAVSTSLVIALVLSILSIILIVCLQNVFSFALKDVRATTILLILTPSIIFSAVYAIFRGALWGQNDYFSCGLTESIEQIVRFILTFIMLYNVSDIFISTKMSAYAFDLTCLISAIIVSFIYFRKGKLCFKKGEYKPILRSAMPITGVRLSNSLVQPLTTLIIPSMLVIAGLSQSEAISSFGTIMGMTFPMLFVPMSVVGSISMVLIPSLSTMIEKKQHEQIIINIAKSTEISLFIAIIFLPLYISVGDYIGLTLFGNLMSGVLLQLSAICIVPITLCNLSGSILNALNLETKSFVNYLLGSLVLLVSLVIFTPIMGINSIILSQYLSMSLVSFLNYRKIKKHIGIKSVNILSNCFKYSLLVIPCALLGHNIAGIVSNVGSDLFCAIVGGGIACALFIVLVQLFKIFDLKIIFEMIKKKNKHT